MAGTWVQLTNAPPVAVGSPVLLTDGTVMTYGGGTSWYRLTPDTTGSYANGAWSELASTANFTNADGSTGYAPLDYASAVLADGRVFAAGGEGNGSDPNTSTCGIYDPVANSWEQVPDPPYGSCEIAGAPCAVLPDGRFFIGASGAHEPTATNSFFIPGVTTMYWDPTTSEWSPGPPNPGTNWEATWTLLPDGTVLCISVKYATGAFLFVPAGVTSNGLQGDNWIDVGLIPVANDVTDNTAEIGPAILLLNGTVINFGSTSHNVIYKPGAPGEPGEWIAAADFPMNPLSPLATPPPPAAQSDGSTSATYTMSDAPAVLLPSGSVLCALGPMDPNVDKTGHSGPPTFFYEYEPPTTSAPGGSFVAVSNPPGNTGMEGVNLRMLLLPTGEVMLTFFSSDVYLYRSGELVASVAVPTITECASELLPGETYTLSGYQLNGLSQANDYGDDASMATNYPLVRIQNIASGKVQYCRTHGHSTMAVATGPTTVVSTSFDVPAGIEMGLSELYVVANGIPSAAKAVSLGNVPVATGISPNSIEVAVTAMEIVTFTVSGTNFEGHGGNPTLDLGSNPEIVAVAGTLTSTSASFTAHVTKANAGTLGGTVLFPDGTRITVPGYVTVKVVPLLPPP